MRKTINLYFKFHFTSLALDAQPISMGVVSDYVYHSGDVVDVIDEVMDNAAKGIQSKTEEEYQKDIRKTKSFYAEFSDYNINHCDDWVKENVIDRLILKNRKDQTSCYDTNISSWEIKGSTDLIKSELQSFLLQFYDCDIQFVMDRSQLGWLWMTELLDERPPVEDVFLIPETAILNNMTSEEFIKEFKKRDGAVIIRLPDPEIKSLSTFKLGLPKLPSNVVVVPQDLNELIAFKEKVTIKEAFDLSRKKLALNPALYDQKVNNALYDAEVIMGIYLQLNR